MYSRGIEVREGKMNIKRMLCKALDLARIKLSRLVMGRKWRTMIDEAIEYYINRRV